MNIRTLLSAMSVAGCLSALAIEVPVPLVTESGAKKGAVEALGAKITRSLAVVDRDQGGSKILADAGCPLTTLVVIKPELFETAHRMGRITKKQLDLVLSFIADPDRFMTDFLLAHPDFLANEIAKGGKSAQRAELCIASGFAPAEALPKA